MAERTPTPWMMAESPMSGHALLFPGDGGEELGRIALGHEDGCGDQKPGNAAFVLRALNSHDELVEALREATMVIETLLLCADVSPLLDRRVNEVLDAADDALAKAEGTAPPPAATPQPREAPPAMSDSGQGQEGKN
jgi:hypothetical protein